MSTNNIDKVLVANRGEDDVVDVEIVEVGELHREFAGAGQGVGVDDHAADPLRHDVLVESDRFDGFKFLAATAGDVRTGPAKVLRKRPAVDREEAVQPVNDVGFHASCALSNY